MGGSSFTVVSEIHDHGSKSSIGTTALQLTTVAVECANGVIVKAANANTGTIYVGNSDVTAAGADGTAGMELGAGESVQLPIDNPSDVWVIASTTGQKVFWMAC